MINLNETLVLDYTLFGTQTAGAAPVLKRVVGAL